MPVYEIETPEGLKFEMEGDTEPTDADIELAIKDLQDQQTDKGFMGSFLPRPVAGALDQFGTGVLQGASELPGLPADLVGLGLRGLDYLGGREKPTENPLEMFSSRTIRSALGQDGLGLIPRSIPRHGVERMANALGQGVGSAGAAGAKGILGISAGLGGGAGSQLAKEVFPDSTVAPIIGGLLGGFGGARLAARAPAPKAGVLDEVLEQRMKAGSKTDPLPDTMLDQADMMSEGGPVGPIREPGIGSTAEEIRIGTEAAKTRGVLDKITLARGLGPDDAAKSLAGEKPAAPDLTSKLLYKTGLAGKESAKNTALYNALKKIEDIEPNVMKDLLGKTAKHFVKGAIHAKIGNPLGVGKAIVDGLHAIITGTKNAKLQAALDELETIVRTGEPIPTKGTSIKNEIKGILGQLN